MKVAYVVLYVDDADTCRRFWIEQVGMVEKRRDELERGAARVTRCRREGAVTGSR